MTGVPAPSSYEAHELIAQDIEAYLRKHQHKSLLRFITCGSVDDGKSTLIGRLLYDTKMIFEDQLAALTADSKRIGTQGPNIDFALLVDGLAAEREQGITIDVAYRYFATEKRKFIVADTPGHEQYTRNMVTGASTARSGRYPGRRAQGRIDADATAQLPDPSARNKEHGAGREQDGPGGLRASNFRLNRCRLSRFRRQHRHPQILLPFRSQVLSGDNITAASGNTPWYAGPALISHLETVEIDATGAQRRPFRMPVQWVNRPNLDFRGFAGLISQGSVRPGDAVRVLPSGRTSTVARVVTSGEDLQEAVAGQSVTLTLADAVDCSRGDVLAAAEDSARDRGSVRSDAGVDGRRGIAARPSLLAEARDADS